MVTATGWSSDDGIEPNIETGTDRRNRVLANTAHIHDVVRKFVLEQFLPGEDAENLGPETELVSTGVLDSICVLKLVTFIEDEFGVGVEPHEADVDHLDTLNRIVALVAGKLDAKAAR